MPDYRYKIHFEDYDVSYESEGYVQVSGGTRLTIFDSEWNEVDTVDFRGDEKELPGWIDAYESGNPDDGGVNA